MRFNILKHPVLLLKSFASVMYIAIGLILIIIPELIVALGRTYSYALGIVLMVYGIFRIFRVVTEAKEIIRENEYE